MKNYNVSDEPVTEVAVDIDDIKENYSEKSRNEECIFLVAGRMIYRKGLDFLFDALMRIPQETKYQVRVVGDGPELEHLRRRCKDNLNLSEHVYCMGSIPYMEMEKQYESADVFIMPSIRETTGTVLVEAMAKGIPVVTINKFGGATLFDKNTGWLYEGNTKEEYIENLKKAILECIANPNEVARRGKNARMKAEKYTWQEKNKKYQKIYKKLLEN
jgi:glycosyltransferase involved in cell wall biosynthesis